MNDKLIENEKKIFDAIQELKDSIFGLNQSYADFCYQYSAEYGYTLDQSKLESFAQSLSETAKQVKHYEGAFEPVLPLFFRMSIMFLAAACNPSDWLFVSIRKLGNTVYKANTEEKSVFDIMVEDSSKYLDEYFEDNIFRTTYEQFSDAISNVDMTNFGQCTKRALERFIDDNNLNTLNDDVATQNIISRMQRTSVMIARDIQRKSRFQG